MADKREGKKIKEARIIIRPIGRLGGLDGIHLSLIILIAILMALLLVVSYPGSLPQQNATLRNCTYGTYNGTCILPKQSPADVRLAAERFLASYADVNTSLSLLPFVADVKNMSLAYLPQAAQWYATLPLINPAYNSTIYFAMLISDKDTSSIVPLLQTMGPGSLSNDYTVSRGVVKLAEKSACQTASPLHIDWFIDPYAPGAVKSLLDAVAEEKSMGSSINLTIEILFTQSSQVISKAYGLNDTLALGEYLFCASQQSQFGTFVGKLNSIYANAYISPQIASELANASSLNRSALQSCLGSAGTLINRQAVLAKYYNITSTPSVVTNCEYLSIPQTESYAICYSNSTLC